MAIVDVGPLGQSHEDINRAVSTTERRVVPGAGLDDHHGAQRHAENTGFGRREAVAGQRGRGKVHQRFAIEGHEHFHGGIVVLGGVDDERPGLDAAI